MLQIEKRASRGAWLCFKGNYLHDISTNILLDDLDWLTSSHVDVQNWGYPPAKFLFSLSFRGLLKLD
jgi:hypothetical protein